MNFYLTETHLSEDYQKKFCGATNFGTPVKTLGGTLKQGSESQKKTFQGYAGFNGKGGYHGAGSHGGNQYHARSRSTVSPFEATDLQKAHFKKQKEQEKIGHNDGVPK